MNEMKLRYDWAQKGLIMPDASTSTEMANSLIGSGKGFGRFTNTKPGIEQEIEKRVRKRNRCFGSGRTIYYHNTC